MGPDPTPLRLALASAGLVVGVAWWAVDRADRRAVRADPMRAALDIDVLAACSRTRRVRAADGTLLFVRETGPDDPDDPVVVLVHGWTCTSDFWVAQLRALAGSVRVVAYDQRGHGRSGTPGRAGVTIEALADDVAAVLAATVPPGRRAVLVGHSMGAMSIVAWARRHPGQQRDQVAAVLLTSTGVGDLLYSDVVVPMPARWRRVKALTGYAFLTAPVPTRRPTPVSRRVVRYTALSRRASPAQVAFTERMVLACRRRVRTRCGLAMGRLDLYDALADLTVPTGVLVGSDDRLTPPVHARRLARDLPDVAFHVELPGVGHMTPIEAPEAVTAAIRALVDTPVRRCPGRSPSAAETWATSSNSAATPCDHRAAPVA